MEIKLTEEQYKQLKEDRYLEINNGHVINLYIEYSPQMDVDYIGVYNTELPAHISRNYALGKDVLETLRQKKPDPGYYSDDPRCPNCLTYMIYKFEHCPRCGQHLDWSGYAGK